MSIDTARREKSSAALSSVIAAVGLTVFKGVVGLLTNSLGILAEAVHSALDLMAAVMTLVAVRAADKPADRNHPYGHAKIENVSALLQTVLLLATAVWIVYEAVRRLIIPGVHVDVTFWSFAVMFTSIVVDVSRTRVLRAAARKHRSQALEADALHFSTDIWSSCVVLFGLGLLLIARRVPSLTFLERGDSLAALAVAAIVIRVSIQLGKRAVHALVDASPMNGEHDAIVQVVGDLGGVQNIHAVRIRSAGGGWFVDMHVAMDGHLSVDESHAITERIEATVETILPGSDVTVHVEPHRAEPH